MKHDYVIFTDAGCGLTKELREKYGIEKQPKSTIVWPDGKEKEADIDWEINSPNEFYKKLSDKKNNFSTSVPAPQTLLDRLEEYAKNNLNVIMFTISSSMSGGFSEATVAAKEIVAKYPNIKIEVIDTLRYGPAIDLLCIQSSLLREQGVKFDDLVKRIREDVLHLHQCGVLDDLFFLARKGRIKKSVAFMGNMVGIKPMADLNNETGLSEVIGKARGYKMLLEIMPKFVERTIGDYKDKVFVIGNSYRSELAEKFRRIIVEKFNPKTIEMVTLSQTTGVNVGPGLCAVYYFSDSRVSPNCVKEKAILTELLNKK